MAPLDEVKRLLDGTVDPDALEANPELYDMAETIYGRDTLEHLGVEAPERPSDSIFQPNGDSKHEVEMPLPNLPTSPDPEVVEGKRSWIIFSLTFIIFALLMVNLVVGLGSVVPLCDSPDSETSCEDKLTLTSIADYESPDSWTEPMSINTVDGVLTVLSTALMAYSLRKK